jgi:hypothetical protein
MEMKVGTKTVNLVDRLDESFQASKMRLPAVASAPENLAKVMTTVVFPSMVPKTRWRLQEPVKMRTGRDTKVNNGVT